MKKGQIEPYGRIHSLIKVKGKTYWKPICASRGRFRVYKKDHTKKDITCEKCQALIKNDPIWNELAEQAAQSRAYRQLAETGPRNHHE